MAKGNGGTRAGRRRGMASHRTRLHDHEDGLNGRGRDGGPTCMLVRSGVCDKICSNSTERFDEEAMKG